MWPHTVAARDHWRDWQESSSAGVIETFGMQYTAVLMSLKRRRTLDSGPRMRGLQYRRRRPGRKDEGGETVIKSSDAEDSGRARRGMQEEEVVMLGFYFRVWIERRRKSLCETCIYFLIFSASPTTQSIHDANHLKFFYTSMTYWKYFWGCEDILTKTGKGLTPSPHWNNFIRVGDIQEIFFTVNYI